MEKIWDEINKDDKVFKLLIETIGVNIPRDLEVYIIGTGLHTMSTPFIMPIVRRGEIKVTKDQFIETIIHEIIHRFIGCVVDVVGIVENNRDVKKYWKIISKEYKDETVLTQNHVLVYAVLEIALLELFGKKD